MFRVSENGEMRQVIGTMIPCFGTVSRFTAILSVALTITVVLVEPAVEEGSDATMAIGMIQINRKNVENRSSFSG